jgi:tRNA(Ile)-lysidine synthetase-like protein
MSIDTLSDYLRTQIPPHSKLLIAVSGGIDSVTLLHALHTVAPLLGCSLGVAHLDHQLRSNSAEDAAFVRELATAANLACYCEQAVPPQQENIEAWGRGVRYKYFERIRCTHGYDWVVTAHNRNDLAETLLLKMLSNREPYTIVAQDRKRMLLRPLLAITRTEIENYARSHALGWREDPTNLDLKFTRNKVRHVLLPTLEEFFGGDVIENLAQEAERLRSDIDELRADARRIVEQLNVHSFGSKEWLRELTGVLRGQSEVCGWRVIEEALLNTVSFRIGRNTALRVKEFILAGHEGIELPGGRSLKRYAGGLIVRAL